MEIPSLVEMVIGMVALRVGEGSWCALPLELKTRVQECKSMLLYENVYLPQIQRFVRFNNLSLTPYIRDSNLDWVLSEAVRRRRMVLADHLVQEHVSRKLGPMIENGILQSIQKRLLGRKDTRRLEIYSASLGFSLEDRFFAYSQLLSTARSGDLEKFREVLASFREKFGEILNATDLACMAVRSGNIAMVLEIETCFQYTDFLSCLGVALAVNDVKMVELCTKRGILSPSPRPNQPRGLAEAVTRGNVEALDCLLSFPGLESLGEIILLKAIRLGSTDLISRYWKREYVTKKVITELSGDWDSPWLVRGLALILGIEEPSFKTEDERGRWVLRRLTSMRNS